MKFLLPFLLTSAPVFASIGEPGVVWENKEATVCWANETNWVKSSALEFGDPSISKKQIRSFDAEQKRVISRTINRNFTRESSGITFKGWRDCHSTPHADIYIIRAQTASLGGGLASIGQNGESICNEDFSQCDYVKSALKKKAFVLINTVPNHYKTTTRETLSMMALHEFGHVAGLRHEHARPEAAQDVACQAMGYGLDDLEDHSTLRFGPYDQNSFMSYCYMFKVLRQGMNASVEGIQFSASDINALRCLYVYKDEEYSRFCGP